MRWRITRTGVAICWMEPHLCPLSLSWLAAVPCVGSWFGPAGSRSSRRSRLWGGTSQKQTSRAAAQFSSLHSPVRLKERQRPSQARYSEAALTWTCYIQTQCAGSPRSRPPSWLSCWCQGRWPAGGRWARTPSPSRTDGELLSPLENTWRRANDEFSQWAEGSRWLRVCTNLFVWGSNLKTPTGEIYLSVISAFF